MEESHALKPLNKLEFLCVIAEKSKSSPVVLSSCYLWHANSMTGVMGIYLVRSVGFSAVRGVGKKL